MSESLILGQEPIDHIALSVDTSDIDTAHRVINGFAEAGGSTLKLGLEAQSVFGGPEGLSNLAADYGLGWVYDGKIKDIRNTMVNSIKNIVAYDHPPVAITIHSDISYDAMKASQEAAGDVPLLGVTLLTDIGPKEAFADYANQDERGLVNEAGYPIEEVGDQVRVRVVMERAQKLGRAGVRGLVASAKELPALVANYGTATAFKMIPGTRSARAQKDDQMNTMTPGYAIAHGADLLVIGRQYLNADDKPQELALIVDEIAQGLEQRVA